MGRCDNGVISELWFLSMEGPGELVGGGGQRGDGGGVPLRASWKPLGLLSQLLTQQALTGPAPHQAPRPHQAHPGVQQWWRHRQTRGRSWGEVHYQLMAATRKEDWGLGGCPAGGSSI